MKVAGTPIDGPRYVTVDPRDLTSLRERMNAMEDDLKQMRRELAIFQQGVKERLDVFSVLLTRLEGAVARKDVE